MRRVLRKDTRRIVWKGILTFMQITMAIFGVIACVVAYMAWESGQYNIEEVFKSKARDVDGTYEIKAAN